MWLAPNVIDALVDNSDARVLLSLCGVSRAFRDSCARIWEHESTLRRMVGREYTRAERARIALNEPFLLGAWALCWERSVQAHIDRTYDFGNSEGWAWEDIDNWARGFGDMDVLRDDSGRLVEETVSPGFGALTSTSDGTTSMLIISCLAEDLLRDHDDVPTYPWRGRACVRSSLEWASKPEVFLAVFTEAERHLGVHDTFYTMLDMSGLDLHLETSNLEDMSAVRVSLYGRLQCT